MSETRDINAKPRPQGGKGVLWSYLGPRLQVLLYCLVALALVGLVILAANAVFDISRRTSALILALGIYVILPVGFVVLVVRKYLRSQAQTETGNDG